MDTPNIKITAQYQPFTATIDWIEIYKRFEESVTGLNKVSTAN